MKKILSLFAIAASLSANAQTVGFSVPVIPCHNDGVLTATLTGFTAPVTVIWTTEGTTGTTITHTVTGTSDALLSYSGGPVSVVVTDGTAYVSTSFAGMPPLSYSLSSTGAVCPSLGSMSVVATGGTAPYTYQWYDVHTGSVIMTGNPISVPAGQYGVIVTDGAGCTYGSRVHTDTEQVVYTSFTATVDATPANCTDGAAVVSAISPSAVLPVSYRWSNGATTSGITGLTSGIYSVEIIDAQGCRATMDTAAAYMPYSVFVPQTTVISVPLSVTPATCTSTDGSISATPSGGTAPYSYSWSNGAMSDVNNGLSVGIYYVTVTDANGCSGEANAFVGTGTMISVSASSSPSLCTSNTGNASVTVSGGTAPYSYQWYTSPAQYSATATGLAPGTYTYKVTDAFGCTQTGVVTVAPINNIIASFSSSSPMCAMSNGSIAVTATGGAAPYSFLWSNGSTSSSVSAVAAGSYNVRITDNMGCKVNAPFSLASYSPITVGLSVADATCRFNSDGSITATPVGGTAPYTYTWNNGSTASVISGLGSGYYSVSVADAAGCLTNTSAHVGYDASVTDCYCTVEGTVYADTNASCTMDAGERGVVHAQVYCSGIGYTYTDANGHYSFMVPSGSYTVTYTADANMPLSACQPNNIAVTATAAPGCVQTVDYAVSPVAGAHDLHISASTIVPPVPGQKMVQQITVVNKGTAIEDSVVATYSAPSQLFNTTFTPSGVFLGSAPWYTSAGFPTLLPGESKVYRVAYNVPANIAVGAALLSADTVARNGAMGAWADDVTPADNYSAHKDYVVAAAAANRKEVVPAGTGSTGLITVADSVLEYTIHFRNTGSATVQNVTITDTLDGNLNWATLRPVYESSPCQVTMAQYGSAKVVTFTLDNINLPSQMTDDQRSSGLVTYSVHINAGLAVGTQIKNRAGISYDYHNPVFTNTTLNTIGETPGYVMPVNNSAMSSSFTVFPNPTSGQFNMVINAELAGAGYLVLTDMSGRVVRSEQVTLKAGLQTISWDASKLTSGLYFVTLQANGKVSTQKLSVVR